MRPRTRSFALQPLAYSKPEAAEVSGLGLTTIKEAVDKGDLAEVAVNARRVILHEDLYAYLVNRRMTHGNGHPTDERPGDAPPTAPKEAPTNNPPRRRGRPPRAAARSPP